MRRQLTIISVLLLQAIFALADESAVPDRLVGAITYSTRTSAYVDVGRDKGAFIGARFDVIQDEKIVARLQVTDLASGHSVCAIENSSLPLRAGLTVRLSLLTTPPRDAIQSGSGSTVLDDRSESRKKSSPRRGKNRRWLSQHGIRGRASIRFIAVDDRTGDGEDYTQPALNLKLSSERIGTSDWGVEIDLRSRRTYRVRTNGETPSEGRTRIYRLSTSWNPGRAQYRITVGRQVSPSLAAVSVFDGLLARRAGKGIGYGILAGTQPDSKHYGLSGEIFEYGLFAEYKGKTPPGNRYSMTVGAIGTYLHGDIDREYLFLQTRLNRGRWMATLSQQADWNRGWRREMEDHALTPTNTFLLARVAITPQFSIDGGYDNRRSIRLYRSLETPETEFDDTYRQGIWGGVTQKLWKRNRIAFRVRARDGGSSPGTHSQTLSTSWGFPRFTGLRIRTRNTRYRNTRSVGWLHSWTLGANLGDRISTDVTYGIRREERIGDSSDNDRLAWTAIDFDFRVASYWYVNLSGETSEGQDEASRSLYSSASYRF